MTKRTLLYHVSFKESAMVEGRIFKEGEHYPVYKKDENYVILVAENGDFAFSNKLMEEAIKEWDLEKIDKSEMKKGENTK